MYRKFFLMLLTVFICCNLCAQQVERNDCGENVRKNARASVDLGLRQQRIAQLGIAATLPYTMKIQVVVFYKDAPTVTDADINRNITNMVNFYRPHNICFVLSDIEYVKDASMANFNAANETQLISYTRPYYLTIFIHTELVDASGDLNGIAYAIPNTYLSVVDDAILSTTNTSTLAHEMGHCFGLYHTFEGQFGAENPARTGSCANCDTKGDYLCDTEADRNTSETSISTSCLYTGTLKSSCDQMPFVMEPRNIMTYGRRVCRDHFTNGQGERARNYILTELMLYNCIAPDVVTITSAVNSSGGVLSLTAKNLINIASPSYLIGGSAQMLMRAVMIRIGPGAAFRPTAPGAKVALRPNTLCQ